MKKLKRFPGMSDDQYLQRIFEYHFGELLASAAHWCRIEKLRYEPFDLTNDCYERMWKHRFTVCQGYERNGPPYLFAIMKNLALEINRGAAEFHLPIEEVNQDLFASQNDNDLLIYEMIHQHFTNWLESLKDTVICQAVKMKMTGVKTNEIAQILDINEKTLYVKFNRFKSKFKKYWKAAFGTDIPKNWKI